MSRAAIVAFVFAAAVAGCPAEAPPPQPLPPPPPPVVVEAPTAPLPPSVEPPPAPVTPLADLQLASLKTAAETINAHDSRGYAALFTPSAIHREAAAPDIVGRDGIAARMELLFRSFPDFRFSFVRVWQKGNVVVATWSWTGTDTGGFLGKKATSRPAGLEGVTIGWYNDDGMVREVRVYEDGQTVVDQLDARAKKGTFRAPPVTHAGMEVIVGVAAPGDDANLRVAKIFYEALENRRQTEILGLFNSDSTADDYAMAPQTARGLGDWKAMVRSWTSAFPDSSQLPLVSQIVVNDYVISERIVHATHRGPVGRIGPTGLPVTVHAVDIMQLKDGKIARFWTWSNTLELVAQANRRARKP